MSLTRHSEFQDIGCDDAAIDVRPTRRRVALESSRSRTRVRSNALCRLHRVRARLTNIAHSSTPTQAPRDDRLVHVDDGDVTLTFVTILGWDRTHSRGHSDCPRTKPSALNRMV